eukprot:CAMPEP_0184686044 /NCGR_PEP_ID=MMETSP0312-20130426/21145_1 /TAXON_ID=31354 /ORGANISM="Compsopogon coeruleus, Strain SAG 36.94" /LENGTH=70 /DNA_ID=CAMNT_0027140753 /DNA_START=68 /DNA_END=277 /DNA_ORIENTATION=+
MPSKGLKNYKRGWSSPTHDELRLDDDDDGGDNANDSQSVARYLQAEVVYGSARRGTEEPKDGEICMDRGA